MADYLQTLRMKNMFPGTETPPQNFDGDYNPYENMLQPQSQNAVLGADPSYGSDFTGPIQPDPPYGSDYGYGDNFTGPMQGPDTSDYDPGQRMNQLYNPQYDQSERLNSLLNQYPQRPPEKTGWGKVGAIAGEMVLGRGFYDEFMHGKHNRAVEDWKMQAVPAQQAAVNERQGNVNERQSAVATISAELRNQAMMHKANNDETRARIAQQRADTYDDKSKNPNFKFAFPKGGNMMILNPADGTWHDSGRPVSAFSKADEMALNQTHALEKIQETGAQGRETERLRQEGRIELEGVKEGNRPPTKTTPLGGNKPEAATQTRVRQASRATEAKNTHPEWRDFINVTGNAIDITPPTDNKWMPNSGPTPEQFRQISKFIYGTAETDRRAAAPGAKITRTVRNKKTGEVKTQYSTDEGKTWSF